MKVPRGRTSLTAPRKAIINMLELPDRCAVTSVSEKHVAVTVLIKESTTIASCEAQHGDGDYK